MQIDGTITRRLLVNFVAEPQVVQKLLPTPFRPQLFNGKAIVGICLIGFKELRLHGMPRSLGMSSENAAHRIAVEWDSADGIKTGVYIVRRDSNSYLKTVLGGRLFSGVHYYAHFSTYENGKDIGVQFESRDGSTRVAVEGTVSADWPKDSVFENQAASSTFFEKGAVGYSPGLAGASTGMQLFTESWKVEPFQIQKVESNFFSDESLFPKGTVRFDHALVMRNLNHYWKSVPPL